MAVVTPIDFSWDAEDEIQLFFALDGLRPFGQNKHFNMALLVERLMNKLGKDINSSILWAKLKTMYNLAALDELEPAVIDTEEQDFALPESWCVKTSTENNNAEDADDDAESKSDAGSKSEMPVSSQTMTNTPTNGTLQVVKEEEKSRTRNSTPARDTKDEEKGGSTVKRTQPKRTRASTSTTDTPNSSPSTPTPMGTKRRRI